MTPRKPKLFTVVAAELLLLAALLRCSSCTTAFQPIIPSTSINLHGHLLHHQVWHPYSVRSNNNAQSSKVSLAREVIGDDDDSRPASDDDDGGKDELSEKFYEQLRKRRQLEEEFSQTTTESNNNETYQVVVETTNNKAPPSQPIRKFTGAYMSSSTPLFTNNQQQQQQSSDDGPSDNIRREREREFNLASRFERTFGIQVGLLVFSFVFFISIGISGGITDGSDRYFGGSDDLLEDTLVEQIERMRTDDAAEAEAMRMMRRQDSASSMIQGSQWL